VSRHKFASNVCEKAIIYAEAEDRRQLIAELIGNKPDGSNNVGMLLCDQYGNFPIQASGLLPSSDHKLTIYPDCAGPRRADSKSRGMHQSRGQKIS
jgi:hypothetical protein